MRNSSLALTLGALVFMLGVLNLLYDPRSRLRSAVDDVLGHGQNVMDEYHARVEARMAKALSNLFDELDVNDDGVIQRAEFKGATVGMMAAMRAMDIKPPQLPAVRLPTTLADVIFVVQIIVTLQFLFLVGIFILVHLHAVVFGTKPSVDLAVDYIAANVPKASKDEAFAYDTPMSKAGLYERAKMAFFILSGVALLRLVLVIIFFVLGVACIQLSVFGGRNRHTHPRWFAFWSYGLTFFGSMLMLSLGFSRIVSHGQLADDAKRKLLVGNHVAVIEVVYLFIHGMMPSFVSRQENLSIPLFPAIASAAEAILVKRDAAESRVATLNAILQRAKDPAANALMVFPEGTCDGGSALFQYKRGAFEAGEPIQMVCFKYPGKHFKPTWNGRDIGGNDLLDLFLRLMCQFVNHMEVVFLPVYTPTPEEKNDPMLYAAHVQQMMAAVLRIPVSDASYQDYVERARASPARHRKTA